MKFTVSTSTSTSTFRRRLAMAVSLAAVLTMMILAAARIIGANAPAPSPQASPAPAGQAKGLTADAIGVVDPAKIQQKFPDYVKLVELKDAYENELNGYQVYLNSQAQSFLAQLKQKKDAESQGKSDEEKKNIEAKYAALAKTKQDELTQQIQAKQKELQDKLNEETQRVDAKVSEAIKAVCEAKGLAVALNKTAVYYGGLDITDEVIAKGEAMK